jgi:hypothetical protein
LARSIHRGDVVRIVPGSLIDGGVSAMGVTIDDTATGVEWLRQVALTRLSVVEKSSIAVSCDQLGLELAQASLEFGADVLFGKCLGSGAAENKLPMIAAASARRGDFVGLVERAGRRAVWVEGGSAVVQEPA